MRFVDPNQVLNDAQEAHKKGDLEAAEKMYNAVFNRARPPLLLYLMGTLYMQREFHGLAILLLQECVKADPKFGPAWNNLAICFKKEHFDEASDFAFEKAEEFLPGPNTPSNRASLYINTGQPERCLELCERALKLDPNHIQSHWHKALALLEMQRWGDAWEWHESRLNPESGCNVDVRNYSETRETPWWDGKTKGVIAIHGEQGLGDEIMFASCFVDAFKTGSDFIIECNPRLEGLFKRSFPQATVIGTHGAVKNEKVTHKTAMGSLPKFFRKSEIDFPGKPYLTADPERSAFYRKRLDDLGQRLKVGIAWQGGVMKTRIDLRSLPIQELKPILELDADFISLQYHKTAQEDINLFEKETGIKIHHWPEAAKGQDMDDQAALISQLDCVVTVCQTAVHVSGGLGIPTMVLCPSKPSWRYGVTGNMPWYESVDLYRQTTDWKETIERIKCSLQTIIGSKTVSCTNKTRTTG